VRRLVVLVGLCACNQVFGLDNTKAQPLDAPMPMTCPAIGGPPPSYSPILKQASLQYCKGYVVVGDTAYAFCLDESSTPFFGSGPVDGKITPMAGFDDLPPSWFWKGAQFAPDGSEVLAVAVDTNGVLHVRIYHPHGDTWSYATDFAAIDSAAFSAPTTTSPRHLLAIEEVDNAMHELVELSPDTWTDVGSYAPTDLEAFGFSEAPAVSPDGLRIVIDASLTDGGVEQVFYSDRATTSDRFRPFVRISGVPYVSNNTFTLTENCARVYFWALQQVFYVTQD